MDVEVVFLEPNKIYHVFAHAVHDNNFFYDDENKQFFLDKWHTYSKGLFRTYAYCLLSNHFHFCIHVEKADLILPEFERLRKERAEKSKKGIDDLPPIQIEELPLISNFRVGSFLNSYTQSLNKKMLRKGTLMRERFGRIEVENRDYLRELICYIHHNPIHHFQVEYYSDWMFSSYNFYSLSLDNEVLSKDNIIALFGSLETFLQYHEEYKVQKNYLKIEQIVENYL